MLEREKRPLFRLPRTRADGLLILLCFTTALAGCKTNSYFKTSNDVLRKNGTVYFFNGKEKTGLITIQFETTTEKSNYIELLTDGETAAEKIDAKTVKGYSINGDYFVPKKVDLYYTGTYNLLFVKRLTPEKSKIQLYELHQLYKSNVTGEELYFYFISLPEHDIYDTWNTYSNNLVPYFDLKMGKIVEDCPELAKKIKSKSKGYFLSQINFNTSKKVAVLKKIIEEYNLCK
jgi:hypothetical protein